MSPDAAATNLAARQHGIATRAQLRRKGWTDDAIDGRIERGWLEPRHRGVYRIGPLEAPHARAMAACLACGPRAWLGYASAIAAWELLVPSIPSCDVDVIVRSGYHRHRGIRVHRVPGLRADEVTVYDGIPITRPGRSLLDYAAVASPHDLEHALAQAYARRLTTPAAMRKLLKRWPRRRGTATLRACLDTGPALTRSVAEERFLRALRRAGLPNPETNVRIGGFEVDFLWRAERLVAEIDGFAFHAAADAFENDRRRDLILATLGLRVVRITWRQLTTEPDAVLARVAQALSWSQ